MRDKDHDDFFDEEDGQKQAESALLDMIDAQSDVVVEEVEAGQKVEGAVLTIGSEYVFVDIGAKNEAMMPIGEVSDKEGVISVNPGDTVEAYVVSTKNDEILLSKSLSGHKASKSELADAMKSQLPVHGKVTGINKGGFNINLMGHRAFCPMSHIDTKFTEDPNVHLSKSYDFVISRITDGGRNVVVSRLPLLQKDIDKQIDEIAENIAEKKVYPGTISRIADFGLFVDLGGVEGLVHVSEVSWERAQDLKKSFSVGQKVECIVLRVEKGKTLRETKIGLSMKQALADPWTTIDSKFSVGQAVDGKVTRLANFGAFVEIAPGIEGLVHVSEMSWGTRVNHPSDVVKAGQDIRVTILGIDTEKRTVSCSLKDVSEDPWNGIEGRFPVGSKAQGTIASKTKFGYFVDVAEGVTGLLVFGNIADDKKDSVKVGEQLEVSVDSVDTERRRMSLSYGVSGARQQTADAEAYMEKQAETQTPASSEFGEMLKAALTKKK